VAKPRTTVLSYVRKRKDKNGMICRFAKQELRSRHAYACPTMKGKRILGSTCRNQRGGGSFYNKNLGESEVACCQFRLQAKMLLVS